MQPLTSPSAGAKLSYRRPTNFAFNERGEKTHRYILFSWVSKLTKRSNTEKWRLLSVIKALSLPSPLSWASAILSSTFDNWLTDRPTVVLLLRSSCLIPCGFEGSFLSVPPHIRSHIHRGSGDVLKKKKTPKQSTEQRWHVKLRRYCSSHDVSEAAVLWWQASLRTAWVECVSAPSKSPPYNLLGVMSDILAQCLREPLKEWLNILEKRFCFIWAAFQIFYHWFQEN